jgi:hypothetical protein
MDTLATLSPTVTTDLLDYAPGSTATVTASNFIIGSTLEFQVLHVTDPGGDGFDLLRIDTGALALSVLGPPSLPARGRTGDGTAWGLRVCSRRVLRQQVRTARAVVAIRVARAFDRALCE